MRLFYPIVCCLLLPVSLFAQKSRHGSKPAESKTGSVSESLDNIYNIKRNFLFNELHNPNDIDNADFDNELSRFNRWFNDVEIRTYPSGNLPKPGLLIKEHEIRMADLKARPRAKTTATPSWLPVGPNKVPTNFNGIGRINCIVIDPIDTNTLYVGAACGGVFISHNVGTTWTSNSDNFPSLSIADIAVNPNHTDTIYAATGDGYGYENTSIVPFGEAYIRQV